MINCFPPPTKILNETLQNIFLMLKLTLVLKLGTFLSSHRLLTSTFVGSTALNKGPRKFWLHCIEGHCALTLRCQNLLWWQVCERCNIFCLLLAAIAGSTQTARSSCVICINWNEV